MFLLEDIHQYGGKTKPAGRTDRMTEVVAAHRSGPALQSHPPAPASPSPAGSSALGCPCSTHLLHVVLCLLHHQVDVGEPEAALEVLQALLKQVDLNVTRFHLHGIQWEIHKPVQMLHLGEGEK